MPEARKAGWPINEPIQQKQPPHQLPVLSDTPLAGVLYRRILGAENFRIYLIQNLALI
jgi:hypothetical protein